MTQYINPVTRSGGVDQIVVADRAATVPVDDAPFDDEQYVRVNGEWVPYTAPPIIPDTLAPKPPTGLTGAGTMASNGTRVDYTLSWTAPTQNTDNTPLDDFAYYVLAWRYAGMTAWSTLTTNDTSYILPSLLPATNIEWQVKARDTSGNDSTWATKTTTGVIDTDPPLQPSQPVLASRLGSIVVSWDGLLAGASAPPADFSYLDVYMSATTGGPWSSIGRLTSSGVAVAAGIDVGATRFFSFVAVDRAGNTSPRSSEASIAVQGVTGPDIEANAVTANIIGTGTMSAAMTITGYLLAGNPTGSRVVIDGEGIRQYSDTGELLTNIPTDPSLPATFEGKVIADEMIIKDFMSLQGLANKIARGAVLTLEGGTSAPAAAPSVAVGYGTYQPPSFTAEYLYVPTGTNCDIDDSDNIVGSKTFFGYGKMLGRGGKWWIGPAYTDSAGSSRSKYGNVGCSTVVAVGGQERLVINSIYCPSNGSVPVGQFTSLDVSVMNTSGTIEPTKKASIAAKADDYIFYWRLGRVLGGLTGTQYPERIAALMMNWDNATNAVSTGKIGLRQYTVSDTGFTPAGTNVTVTSPFVTDEGPIGVTHGRVDKLFPGTLPAGVASTDFIWLIHGSVKTYAYNASASMARVPDFDFDTPPGAARMNAWGDPVTNSFLGFRTTEWGANGPITKMTNNHWVGSTSSKWWASTTNFDSNITGGTHESPQGPRASITMKKRAGLLVTVPPYPVRPDPVTNDDPLSAKVYIARGASDPGYLYMEYAGQTDDPNRNLLIGDFTFPAGVAVDSPPATGDFPASSPAKVVPGATTNWYLLGDGSAKIGGLTVAVNTTCTLDPVHELVMGQSDQANQRLLKFRKKNNSSAVVHEIQQYAFDGGLSTVIRQDAVEQYRTELSQVTGLRMLRASDSAQSYYRADGVISTSMRTLMFEGDGTTVSTTSTTGATMGTAGAQGTFVAPPSGVITVTVGGQIRNATAGQSCVLGYEIKTGSTIGSGTVFQAYHIDRTVLNANVQNIRAERTFLVSGLTAGSTYNIRTIYATTNSSASASAAWCALILRPEP